jgi:sec-independent protein translocase protein TatA
MKASFWRIHMGPIGWTEMVVIFFVALVVFGPEKLPDLAKTAAKGLREFKKATEGLKSNWEEHLRDVETPVSDIKKTFEEAKADVAEASAKITEEEPPVVTAEEARGVISEESLGVTAEEVPAPGPEEPKPDAN